MKKIVKLISLLLLSVFTLTSAFAASGEVVSEENISYTYYYGQGCSYCAKVDRYMNSVDGWEKVNIDKNEIYFDDQNRESMLADGKRLGIDEKQIGVPFLIINKDGVEIPMIGDKPIIEHFTPILGEPKESNAKGIVLVIIGILAIIIPVFLIKMTSKN